MTDDKEIPGWSAEEMAELRQQREWRDQAEAAESALRRILALDGEFDLIDAQKIASASAPPQETGRCICQNQHRRGYCTEPGCPYGISAADGVQRLRAELQQLRDFAKWVDSWVSQPVGAYSVYALDGLFGMTRDKLAALSSKDSK